MLLLDTTMSEPVAPESTLPYPPIHQDKKVIVLSDWDGTITTFDSNDYMTDNLGFGKARRREGNLEILAGQDIFRDGFRKMLASVVANGFTFEQCKEILRQSTWDTTHMEIAGTSFLPRHPPLPLPILDSKMTHATTSPYSHEPNNGRTPGDEEPRQPASQDHEDGSGGGGGVTH
ncbi:hypothetical protein BDZ97DRAFT_1302320 [Flammula alnicola]|nr:hypothetical protein BDZ97DRAFT_1302320 [Flammula alnicola]